MDPFMNGYLYSPKYYGSISALKIIDPFVNGSQPVAIKRTKDSL